MNKILLVCLLVAGTTISAFGQDAPNFFKDTYPEHALQDALKARSVLEGENAELDKKTRELIALAVAAQIPCAYCAYGHTKAARNAGATEGEVREAVATAAQVRLWSTVLNGMQYDLAEFIAEHDELVPTQ